MANTPILYCSPPSPLCRSVILTAAEIGLELDLRRIHLTKGENLTPEFLKISPHGQLPVLDDNGTILNEHHVICMYLCEKYSSNEHLYPKDPIARYSVIERLFFDCGYINARLRKVIEPIVWYGSTELWHEAVQYVRKAYTRLESNFQEGPYICGQHMTIADLCLIASVSTANDLTPINPDNFPKTVVWMERMSRLPYYQRCNCDGAEMLARRITTQLEKNKSAWE